MALSNEDTEEWFFNIFPYLREQSYSITSPRSDDYNCIAWAAGDTENWWWVDDESYWVEGLPREHTLECFILAFQTLGYDPCDFDESVEPEFEKVVIYTDDDHKPQHMAKQLASGYWSSKLGRAWDIEHHTVQSVEGINYGRAIQMLKRPKQ